MHVTRSCWKNLFYQKAADSNSTMNNNLHFNPVKSLRYKISSLIPLGHQRALGCSEIITK